MNPFDSNNRGRGRGRKPSSSNTQDDSEKKIIHRDVERQRRQEMSNLYASLRDVLPAEYIKVNHPSSFQTAKTTIFSVSLSKLVSSLALVLAVIQMRTSRSTLCFHRCLHLGFFPPPFLGLFANGFA